MEPGDEGGEGFDFHGRWNYKCLESGEGKCFPVGFRSLPKFDSRDGNSTSTRNVNRNVTTAEVEE